MRSDLLFPQFLLLPEVLRRPARTGGHLPRRRRVAGIGPAALLAAALVGGGGTIAPAGPVLAQSDPSMQAIVAKLNRLEADLNSLQRNVYRGTVPDRSDTASPAASGDIGSQLYTYEESLRRLTAQVEELAHQQRQMDDRLTRLSEDVEFRLQEIEGKLGLSAVGGTGGSGGGTSVAAAPADRDGATPAGTQQLGTLSVDRDSGTPRGAQAGTGSDAGGGRS
ncbi:hypothetical protein ACFOGJ_23910, partial [Marinibaculum pumilum]